MSSLSRDALSRKFDEDAEKKGATVAKIIWATGESKDAVVIYDFGGEEPVYTGYVWRDNENKYKGTTAGDRDLDHLTKWSIGFLKRGE